MSEHHHHDHEEQEIRDIERRLRKLEHELSPHLMHVKILFTPPHHHRRSHTMPVQGPVTLTSAGQVTTASLLGFDQFGNPMPSTFIMPQVTFAIDSPAIASLDPTSGVVTAVANGVANLTASVTSAEGLTLSDTETVTVAIPTVAPVLSSVKLAFA